MKKILLFVVVAVTATVVLASCAPGRRGTGCPMTDKIIH